ncbi:MAG: hypothetical protein LQ351_003931 [Letrouitia transgressa]|nr:MAG: hypothetical protein LQ351_003931 [Letrouitia transgressa]
MPENIQDNLARLELDATPSNRLSGLRSPSPIAEMQGSNTQAIQNSSHGAAGELEQPSFSPFPRLQHRPANVPPSDEERENILENARPKVLNSSDPEVQLTWAQDALAYVEVVSQDALRSSESRAPTPQVEHQLRVDAINVVSFLADQGHPKAEFMKGMWLEFGKFKFRMDKKEAFRCYSRAAQNGYARAEYRLGMQFESSNDLSRAIVHYNIGIRAGDSASHYRLGMMTLLGQHGERQDYTRGIALIKIAADLADENAPQGAYVYGMLQARELKQVNVPDQYLPMDIAAGRYYIEKAAYLGFAKAQTKMGAAYELCQLGCEFDAALSLHYNALAARQGEPEADMAISKWFLCGQKDVFEKNDELAYFYAERAAQTGLPTAEFAMGYFFEVGIHVRSDLNEARSWYTKAADHGYEEARARIDGISRSNTLSKKDHQHIAIARIQSMHGSQRGKRPDRYRLNEQMPTIQDNQLEMPEPNPPKPYQDERRMNATPSNSSFQRPASVTPYPLDDSFGTRPNPAVLSAISSPNLRTQIDGRPSSVASVPPASSNGTYRPPTVASMRPPRSFSSQGNINPSLGRGAPVPGAMGPQGYRQPSSGLSSMQNPGSPLSAPSSPRPPPIDIGFSAPLDPSGADRRGRLQKTSTRPSGGVKPLPGQTSDSKNPQRISSLPETQAATRKTPTSSPIHQSGLPFPKPSETPTNLPTSKPSSSAPGPTLPPKVPSTQHAVPTPPPTMVTRPPGKGPKTFDEMGVPAQKQKDECVSVLSTSRAGIHLTFA